MTGLTHEQARRYLSAAADQCLNPHDRAVLEAHLVECQACSAYAAEIQWLDSALNRALKNRWTASRRSPSDLAIRVQRRIRAQANQRFFIGFANTLVKLGSLAVVAALAVSLTHHQRVEFVASPTSTATNASLTSNYSRLPAFELESENETVMPNDAEQYWQVPALMRRQFRVMHY